jgi:hypothetical protein
MRLPVPSCCIAFQVMLRRYVQEHKGLEAKFIPRLFYLQHDAVFACLF